MSDRERLAQLSREAAEQRARDRAELERQQAVRKAAEQAKLDEEKQRTAELRAICDSVFTGEKLLESGHDLTVGSINRNPIVGIERDGGPEFVTVNVYYWPAGLAGFSVPVLMCRYREGRYELLVGSSFPTYHQPDLDTFKATLIQSVAQMGQEWVNDFFAAVKLARWR